MTEKVTTLGPNQYMVGSSQCSCDWRWPTNEAVWNMSSKEGVRWDKDGPLSHEGRNLLIEHFGLEKVASQLPLEIISAMSPATLLKLRRELEASDSSLPVLNPVSARIGGHIEAAKAA